MVRVIVLVVICLAFTGCSSRVAEEKDTVQPTALEEGTEQTLSLVEGQITLQPPQEWIAGDSGRYLLLASYSIEDVNKEDGWGYCIIKDAHGESSQEIERWTDLFHFVKPFEKHRKPKVETRRIGDVTVRTFELEGTYLHTPGHGYYATKPEIKENARMLAAYIELPPDKITKSRKGIVIEFAGPSAVIAENEKQFEGMLKSIQLKKNSPQATKR